MRYAQGAVVIDEKMARRGKYGTATAKKCQATKIYRHEMDLFYEGDGEPKANILPWIHRILRKRRSWSRTMAKHKLRKTLVNRFPMALDHYLAIYHALQENYETELFRILSGDHPAHNQARLHVQTEWFSLVMKNCVEPLAYSYQEILRVATAAELKLALEETTVRLGMLTENEIKRLIVMVTMASRVAKGNEMPYTPMEFSGAVSTARSSALESEYNAFIGAQDFTVHYLRLIDERDEVLAYLELERCKGRDEIGRSDDCDGIFLDADDIDETVGRVWLSVQRNMYEADWEHIDTPSIKMEVVQGFPLLEYVEYMVSERQLELIYPFAAEETLKDLDTRVHVEQIDGRAVGILELGAEHSDRASEAYTEITDLFRNNDLYAWTPAGTVLQLRAASQHHGDGRYVISSDGYFRWVGPEHNTEAWHALMKKLIPAYEPTEVVLGSWHPHPSQTNLNWNER